jgi:hypothetical protein
MYNTGTSSHVQPATPNSVWVGKSFYFDISKRRHQGKYITYLTWPGNHFRLIMFLSYPVGLYLTFTCTLLEAGNCFKTHMKREQRQRMTLKTTDIEGAGSVDPVAYVLINVNQIRSPIHLLRASLVLTSDLPSGSCTLRWTKISKCEIHSHKGSGFWQGIKFVFYILMNL